MSAPFPLKVGDTKREIARKFLQGGKVLANTDPSGVTMRIRAGETLVTRAMSRDANGVHWYYRFVDADFVAVPAGEYDVDFELAWADGKATDPSTGKYRLVVEATV